MSDALSMARFIVLDENLIQDLPVNTFKTLTMMRVLHLNSNQITELHAESFNSLPRFQYLHVDDNQIDKIDENFFEALAGLLFVSAVENVCINEVVRGVPTEMDKFNVCFGIVAATDPPTVPPTIAPTIAPTNEPSTTVGASSIALKFVTIFMSCLVIVGLNFV